MTSAAPNQLSDRTESERFLVGVVVEDGRRFLELHDLVTPADFLHKPLAAAWQWFGEMTTRGQTISSYSLHQAYGSHALYADFCELRASYADGVLPVLAKDYANDVAAHARRERARFAIARLQAISDSACSAGEIAEEVQRLFEETCSEPASKSARKASQIVAEIEHDLANPVAIPRFRTGFPSLDRMLKGGFKGGQLVIIAGRTGGGKTVLGMNLAVQAASDGVPVVAFSLEMSDKDLVTRCILAEGFHRSEADAFDFVRGLPLWVDPTSSITARGIASKIKLLNARHGAKLFVVDYLQLLGVESGSRDSRERIVADMSRTLKIVAKELDVAVIALSQVNADGELRESRAIEQDADVVLHVVDLPEDDGPEYNHYIRVTKQRGGEAHGPVGRLSKDSPGIPVRFNKPHFRFSEQ